MKKIITVMASVLFMITLNGCGSTGSTGGTTGMTGGGSGGGLPISGMDGGSMGGSMDIGSLMGGLMGGGGGDDDDDSSSGGDDTTTNSAPLAFTNLGSVGITYDGADYPMEAVYSRDGGNIIPPNYTQDENGTYTVQIAAYDVREERLHTETGSLVFSFHMDDLTARGTYPLITNVEGESGDVVVTSTYEFNNHIEMKGYISGATFYSVSQESFYTVSLSFDVTVYPAPQPTMQQ